MSNNVPQKSDGPKWRLPVAAILILFVIIAVPSFIKARHTSSQYACVNKLRQIDGAKDQWAIEHDKKSGDQPTWNELSAYIIGQKPIYPQGGTYSLNPIGTTPTCSIGTGSHVLK